MTAVERWREAANVLREHAIKFDKMADEETICGVVCQCGPNGEPLACGYKARHDGPHAWSTLPTWVRGGEKCVVCQSQLRGSYCPVCRDQQSQGADDDA